LDAPRDGRKDELRQIKGISPQTEAALNHLGIFHFDQIADWDKKAVVWIDNHLALKGRPGREKWIEQARDLAKARVPALRALKH
jgi:NADH-quinone oxidoreductase subunit E